MQAVIKVARCVLHRSPDTRSEPVDEVLLGWEVEVLEAADGWVRLRTDYGYEGFAFGDCLELDQGRVSRWHTLPKAVFGRAVGDVLPQPCYQASPRLTLLRGGLVGLPDPAQPEEWRAVMLPDGQTGFVRSPCVLSPCVPPDLSDPAAFRRKVCRNALSYLGVPYRWGGKTPLGIDCSGLTFMAYWLAGVALFRDAEPRAGYPMLPIPPQLALPGDLLYYPGHVALYLGEERYLHATGQAGADGVVLNSLRPGDATFRPDLAWEHVLTAGRLDALSGRGKENTCVREENAL